MKLKEGCLPLNETFNRAHSSLFYSGTINKSIAGTRWKELNTCVKVLHLARFPRLSSGIRQASAVKHNLAPLSVPNWNAAPAGAIWQASISLDTLNTSPWCQVLNEDTLYSSPRSGLDHFAALRPILWWTHLMGIFRLLYVNHRCSPWRGLHILIFHILKCERTYTHMTVG